MDHQSFGAFIASLRKEKGWTQRELASQLHVTDKAISKWERGLGFPDIQTIEPLAEALGVTVLEIMRSHRIQEDHVSAGQAEEALDNVIDVVSYQRKIEQRNIIITLTTVSIFIMVLFLIDTMELLGFVMVSLPIILFIIGIVLLVISWKRHQQKLSYSATLTLGVLAMLFPMILFGLLFFAFALGAPSPI